MLQYNALNWLQIYLFDSTDAVNPNLNCQSNP